VIPRGDRHASSNIAVPADPDSKSRRKVLAGDRRMPRLPEQRRPPEVRKLARSIMRRVMGQHRRPDLSRISMRLDHRAGCIAAPVKATQGGRVGWWINLSTMVSGKKIAVPLG